MSCQIYQWENVLPFSKHGCLLVSILCVALTREGYGVFDGHFLEGVMLPYFTIESCTHHPKELVNNWCHNRAGLSQVSHDRNL